MTFLKPPEDNNLLQAELDTLKWWQENSIFQKSIDNRNDNEEFVFYDGPPFATGLPHYGHLVPNTLKDVVPRYWTMRGFKVQRRFGWDTHGLPIELLVEKKLELSGPTEIKEYGYGNFNEVCRENVLTYTEEWRQIINRLGRWVDFDNDYKTMDLSFMESVWWVFSQLWNKNLVSQEFKVMPYSCRLSTSLSNFEASLNYQDVQAPTLVVGFVDALNQDVYLIWTTTPWTLPANLAIGINPDIKYVKVKLPNDSKTYVVAESCLTLLGKGSVVLEKLLGSELIGRKYLPLFPYFSDKENAFQLLAASFVKDESGTGLVHLAPDFGEDDFQTCKENNISVVDPLDDEGNYRQSVTDFAGQNYLEAQQSLIKLLKQNGVVLKHDTIQHSYPYCWRSNTPLIYRAVPAWFIKVSQLKEKMLEHNRSINWVPEHVGQKRFANWVADAKDWNISRTRFWGTPLPIWKCSHCKEYQCLDSVASLELMTGQSVTDLHPHKIDGLGWSCQKCLQGYCTRVEGVFDCWFESGSMPYAQVHYPFNHEQEFHFPAQFIAEGLDQTRGWFYTLLVLSTALFDRAPFQNCIVNGLVLAEDGTKMSKSKENYTPVEQVLAQYGADALRATLIGSPVVRAESLKFSDELIRETSRGLIVPLHNAWKLFVQYANMDGWTPDKRTEHKSDLDLWICSIQQTLIQKIDNAMEAYQVYEVIPLITQFVDNLTNWYIRLSRRRFWKTENDLDKAAAYTTLYDVLVSCAKTLAPYMPFLAEEMYQSLVLKNDKQSVHLCDWESANVSLINLELEKEMELVRDVVQMGRRIRTKQGFKNRQPLKSLTINHPDQDVRTLLERQSELIKKELNVKELILKPEAAGLKFKANYGKLGPKFKRRVREISLEIEKISAKEWATQETFEVLGETILKEEIVVVSDYNDNNSESDGLLSVRLDLTLTESLLQEGMVREVISLLQDHRKEVGCDVGEPIEISWFSPNGDLTEAILLNQEYLEEELFAALSNEFERENVKLEVDTHAGDKLLNVKLKRPAAAGLE